MANRDTITGLFLLAVCAFAWHEVANISKMGKFFPQVCIVILAFFSGILLIQGLRKHFPTSLFEGIQLKYVKFMIVGIILYLTAIVFIGFFLGSLLFLTAYGLFLDSERNKKTAVQAFLVGLFATTLFYFVFHNIFSVPLPIGLIFGR